MNAALQTRKSPRKPQTRGPKLKRLPPGVPNPVDIHVGSRVRLRRTLLGLSQGKLGEAVGLTFQQIQKYERGSNRIGASRLFELSRILDVPITGRHRKIRASPSHYQGALIFAENSKGYGANSRTGRPPGRTSRFSAPGVGQILVRLPRNSAGREAPKSAPPSTPNKQKVVAQIHNNTPKVVLHG